ncbi:MAG: response regulator, partial [bacterium]|nr:response regulator [bacterium]
MNEKILVIDDSPTLRRLLQFYLKKKNYSVNVASDGQIGLEAIEKDEFDLIILDMDMPVMSG